MTRHRCQTRNTDDYIEAIHPISCFVQQFKIKNFAGAATQECILRTYGTWVLPDYYFYQYLALLGQS